MTQSSREFCKTKATRSNKARQRAGRRLRLEPLEDRRLLAVLLADSFEQSEWNGNWVEDGQNDWARTTQRSADGAYAAEVDGSAANATLSMASPLDLTSYGSADLTFSWYIERSFDSGEYIALDLYDGNSWNEVASLKGNVDQENVWHNETVTIDGSYLVSDFQLRFRASVSSSNEDGFVDNVKIEGTLASSELAINDVQLAEGDSGTNGFVFTVARSGDTSGASTVDFSTADATATSGSDYGATSGAITFNAGEISKTITVSVNGDTTLESDELFVVNLSNATGATIADGIGQGTILDDDVTPTISFADFSDSTGLTLAGNAAIANGNILRLTPAASGMQGAAWYTAKKQFVSVDWETTFQFNLNENIGDFGGSDGFVFIVQNHAATYLAGGGGTLGYQDLPNSLAVEFDTFQNSEVSDPSPSHISVHTNGTGPNGWDEALSLGTYDTPEIIDDAATHTAKITYTPGTLTIFLDDLATPVLSVAVDLDSTLELDSGRAWVGFTGTTGGGYQNHDILNWDYRVLTDTTTTIAVESAEVIEGNAGPTNLVLTVMRQGDTSGTTTVDWATANGTATAGSDYVSNAGQVTFGPGDTQQTITITVNGDTVAESHETLFVNLSNAVGATVVVDMGVGTILNDETYVSIDDVSVVEGDESIQFIDDFITSGSGGLNGPNAMALGPDGNFYVAGQSSDNVLRYNPATGDLIDEFVSAGSGGLDSPRGLIFGADGNLYISSQGTDSVLRYQGPSGANPGQFIDSFVSTGSGGLDGPFRGTFGPDGNLYVSSAVTDSVLRYQGPFGTIPGQFIDTFVATASGGLDAPAELVFGADGNLYVSSGNTDSVLRYQGPSGSIPGQFIDTFVATASGGLDAPWAFIFGADGNLYVSSGNTDSVLRYQGPSGSDPGQFVDTFVPTGGGGLDNPRELTFGADGNLYIVSKNTAEVLRYGVSSQVAFTVNLSSPSALPVMVDFNTSNFTATAGSDYESTSGTLVFAPGTTTRTIIVPTIDDAIGEPSETFDVVLSNSSGAAILDDTGVATIIDDDSNNAPVAIDDAATSDSEVEKIIDVLANDFDSDGDTLTVDSVVSPTSGGGMVVINPDNTLSYTSAGAFSGIDSFDYTISDDRGGTATATVTIDVSEVATTAIFVADIRFDSRKDERDWRAVVEIRDETGAAVGGATITVTFNGQTFTGQTGSDGTFRTVWQPKLSSGSYQAEVVDLALLDHTWDTTQGWLGDTDGDGLPDSVLNI